MESSTLTLLNTRSLNKHAIDVMSTSSLTDTDVLCLTETQIVLEKNTSNVRDILKDFECFFSIVVMTNLRVL